MKFAHEPQFEQLLKSVVGVSITRTRTITDMKYELVNTKITPPNTSFLEKCVCPMVNSTRHHGPFIFINIQF